MGLVVGRSGGQQRQRVKHLRLNIRGIVGCQLLHRVGVALGFRCEGRVVVGRVDDGQRADELTLAIGASADLLGALHLLMSERDICRRDVRLPKLVVVAHGNSPMSHGAAGIFLGDPAERAFRGGVGERM